MRNPSLIPRTLNTPLIAAAAHGRDTSAVVTGDAAASVAQRAVDSMRSAASAQADASASADANVLK